MARTRRIKKDGDGHYHVMSRTNGKAFLFGSGRLKTEMVELLKRTAEFSGVTIIGYAIMDNHFHAVIDIVKPDAPVSEREILRRIAILKGKKFADVQSAHWAELRRTGLESLVEPALETWRHRMHDVSEFVKTYKELVTIAYKRTKQHCGSIWSGRFTSTLVEGGEYLSICRRYIELNPVRAGLARQSAHYPWCSAADSTLIGASAGSVPASAVHASAGSVPAWEERMMKRIVQIGAGKIFGSLAYVEAMLAGVARGLSPSARPRAVFAGAFATHGWRLAA